LIDIERKQRFIVNFLYYGIITLGIYTAIYICLKWLMPFVIGFGIAMIIKPLVDFISRFLKGRRKVVSFVVIVIFYTLVVIAMTFVTIQTITFLRELFSELPSIYDNQIVPALEQFNHSFEQMLLWVDPSFKTVLENFSKNFLTSSSEFITTISSAALSMVSKLALKIPSIILSFIFVVISSFFFTSDFLTIKTTLKNWSGQRLINTSREVKAQLGNTTGKFLLAFLKIMSITFIELSILFLIIGLPNPIGLAFLIAAIDILPVLGTGGIMIPWALIELLLGNYTLSLQLAVIYIIVTVIRNMIEPKIVGDQVGLHPIFMLVSMVIGVHLFGAIGILLFPIISVIVKNIYELRIHKNEGSTNE